MSHKRRGFKVMDKSKKLRRISFALAVLFTLARVAPASGLVAGPQPPSEAAHPELDSRKSVSYEGSSEAPPIRDVQKDPKSWENFLNGSPLRPLETQEDSRDHDAEKKPEEKESEPILTISQKMRAERSFRQALEKVTVREKNDGILMEAVFFKALGVAVDAMIRQDDEAEKVSAPVMLQQVPLAETNSSATVSETSPVTGLDEIKAPQTMELSAGEAVPVPEIRAESTAVVSRPEPEPVISHAVIESSSLKEAAAEMKMDPPVRMIASSQQVRQAREESLESLMQKLDEYVKQKIAQQPAVSSEEYSENVDRLVDSFVEKVQSAAGEVARKIREFYLPERARKLKTSRRALPGRSREDFKVTVPLQPAGLLAREISTLLPVPEAADIAPRPDRSGESIEDLPADTQFLLRFMGIEHFHPWVSILMSQRMSVREKDELRKMLERMIRPNGDEENPADARYRNNPLKLGIAHLTIAQAVTGNLGPYLPPGFNHQTSTLDEQREKIIARSNKLYGRRPSRD